jgi:hypothetical protein
MEHRGQEFMSRAVPRDMALSARVRAGAAADASGDARS